MHIDTPVRIIITPTIVPVGKNKLQITIKSLEKTLYSCDNAIYELIPRKLSL